jgi:hypothetical protein
MNATTIAAVNAKMPGMRRAAEEARRVLRARFADI